MRTADMTHSVETVVSATEDRGKRSHRDRKSKVLEGITWNAIQEGSRNRFATWNYKSRLICTNQLQ